MGFRFSFQTDGLPEESENGTFAWGSAPITSFFGDLRWSSTRAITAPGLARGLFRSLSCTAGFETRAALLAWCVEYALVIL